MSATIFLRFASKSEFENLLPAGVENPQGDFQIEECAVSVVGTIDGAVGYHVNACGLLPDRFSGFQIAEPGTPARVFAE